MSSDFSKSTPLPARVLCADDEPAMRDVLCALLRREGYHAESVRNGLEAWRKLAVEGGHFDLLITDNEMPALTGSGLVQMAREAELPVKIVVFSASLTPNDEATFRAWGVDAMVAKGAPIDELLDAVRRLLQPATANARASGRIHPR